MWLKIVNYKNNLFFWNIINSLFNLLMVKGFSDNEVKNNTQKTQIKETKKEKKD